MKLENKANEYKSKSSSHGIGLSTDLVQTTSMLGSSQSKDTFLNEAYIKGAVDFMHADAVNQGCCVMDITNHGASYQYIPMEEVHKERSYANLSLRTGSVVSGCSRLQFGTQFYVVF